MAHDSCGDTYGGLLPDQPLDPGLNGGPQGKDCQGLWLRTLQQVNRAVLAAGSAPSGSLKEPRDGGDGGLQGEPQEPPSGREVGLIYAIAEDASPLRTLLTVTGNAKGARFVFEGLLGLDKIIICHGSRL
jgi:hypothetical protein